MVDVDAERLPEAEIQVVDAVGNGDVPDAPAGPDLLCGRIGRDDASLQEHAELARYGARDEAEGCSDLAT